MFKPFFFILASSLLFLPASASAQLVSCQNNCTVCDFLQTIDNLLRFLTEISFVLAVAVIVYGAFNIMTAGGNSAKYEAGKSSVTISLTGIVIVLISWVFIHQLLFILAGNRLFQGNFSNWIWNEIPCEVEYDTSEGNNIGDVNSGLNTGDTSEGNN